jgi:hypothetical protein
MRITTMLENWSRDSYKHAEDPVRVGLDLAKPGEKRELPGYVDAEQEDQE